MSPLQPTVCLTFDFDAISLWVTTFGLTTPTAVSRGEFGARVGVPRILEVLSRERTPATFYIPGHTVETYPELCRRIRDLGHEIGHHGYLHENPVHLDEADERSVLEKGVDSLERVLGVHPAGYRSPGFDLSPNSTRLLHEYGFAYDSSMMAQDFEFYWCRTGDRLHPDGPFEFGEEIDLVEAPISWSLDDFPQFEFVLAPPIVSLGLGHPPLLQDRWIADLDFMVSEVPHGVFTMTFHPQTIGRGARLRVLEAIIQRAKGHGARFLTVSAAVADWREHNTPSPR